MKFRDIKNLETFKKYCNIKNTKWYYTPIPQNSMEIEIVFYYYSTPLAFVDVSGTVYYLEEYTKEYFISTTTCWYLSHLKNIWRYTPNVKDFIGLENYEFTEYMKQLISEHCIYSIGKLGRIWQN